MTSVCHGGKGGGGLEALTKMLAWANKGESENKKCWQGGGGGGSEDQIHTDVIKLSPPPYKPGHVCFSFEKVYGRLQ